MALGTDTLVEVPSAERSAPPHPRIRARRIEVRRDEGRRRRRRLLGLVALLAVVTAVALVLRSPLFQVDRIVVSGAVHTPVAAVDHAAGIRRGQAMLNLDTAAAARSVARLPWVRTVSVERSWPRLVRIVVTERRPVAQARSGSGWASLDVTGRVLALSGRPVPGLVTVAGLPVGPPGSSLPASVGPVLRLAAALPKPLEAQVASISSTRGDLSMVLVDGSIKVRIGPPTQVAAKLQALSAVLASAPRTPPIDTIDVLEPSAPVLTRHRQGLDQ